MTCMHQWTGSLLVQVMACSLFDLAQSYYLNQCWLIVNWILVLTFELLFAKCQPFCSCLNVLTHWGRVTQMYVGILSITGSDNGLLPGRCQAIIWTNAGILLIGPWGTNFSKILFKIQTFSLKKNTFGNVVCEMFSISSQPHCVKILYPKGSKAGCVALFFPLSAVMGVTSRFISFYHLCSMFSPLKADFDGSIKFYDHV